VRLIRYSPSENNSRKVHQKITAGKTLRKEKYSSEDIEGWKEK
jgi:hypothetical protein